MILCALLFFSEQMMIYIRNIILLLVAVSLSACSVVMAARNNGVNPKKISECKTRNCIIATGATPLDGKRNKDGHLISETFRADMPTGSAARAAMHGLLDVGTLGLWEVAGTPIEAVKDRKKGYVVDVNYKNDGNSIKHMSFNF
jgi:hypothetical protein